MDTSCRSDQLAAVSAAVLVTGMSGAGKTTVARALRARGFAAVDADDVDGLSHWAARDGTPVERPDDPSAAWLDAHEWVWDPARLDSLVEDGLVFEQSMRSVGAIPVDATAPLHEVVAPVLAACSRYATIGRPPRNREIGACDTGTNVADPMVRPAQPSALAPCATPVVSRPFGALDTGNVIGPGV